MVKIKFCGAARTVTGSCYFITTAKTTFVVDCGMFQGPEVENLNLNDFEFDASKVAFACLTHAHIDHSGMMPKLVKHGFDGKIYATANTIQISSELLMDSAKIQEHSYEKGQFYGKYTNIKAIVYNTRDAEQTIANFSAVSFDDEFEAFPGIKVKYIRAGHILGAASIEVTFSMEHTGTREIKVIFSGDIGRAKQHIDETFDVNYSSEPDYVLMESLYGGETHPDRDESAKTMVEIINKTTKRQGNAFIPCFAVQRTQEVLNDIRVAKESKEMDLEIPVLLDSPLAQRVTGIYRSALQYSEKDLFDFDNLIYVKKYKQSLQLSKRNKQVIIAGSGMADGGRIIEHLTTGLTNPRNSVIFVGFQAEGTLGRKLVEGAKEIQIANKRIQVKAEIYQLQGFSAHGDTHDYLQWINRFRSTQLKKIFLVHAEIERSEAMQMVLRQSDFLSSYIPSLNEELVLE